MPFDGDGGKNFLFSVNFFSFAIEEGWYDPAGGKPFNANLVYGDGKLRWKGVAWVEEELKGLASRPVRIGLQDIIGFLRTSRLTGGYGRLRADCPAGEGAH